MVHFQRQKRTIFILTALWSEYCQPTLLKQMNIPVVTGQRLGHAELSAATALIVMNILSPTYLICSHLLPSPPFLLRHSFSII